MTKLDVVLERIRQLPQERQDMLAVEMEYWLDFDAGEAALSAEQEAELARRLAERTRQTLSHEEVGALFEGKDGR